MTSKDIFDMVDPMKFSTMTVGFDDMIKKLQENVERSSNYMKSTWPPYNIKKVDENKFVIETAVAGFGTSDLTIEMDGGRLIISGKSETDKEESQYLHKGIADRTFTRSFVLNDNVEVTNAELLNGMLSVYLEAITPEENKVKIEIKEKKADGTTEKQVLKG
jgi:molecular chaperone IbpA